MDPPVPEKGKLTDIDSGDYSCNKEFVEPTFIIFILY